MVKFQETDRRLVVKLSEGDRKVDVLFSSAIVSGGNVAMYNGPYSVEPRSDSDQTLETAQKYMKRDVTVKKIQYAEVSNNSGGTTVTIGEEV